MMKTISITIISFFTLLISSCCDSDHTTRCINEDILIANKSDYDIIVEYTESADEFDVIQLIFDIDGCDITDRSITISPRSEAEIEAFFGSCDYSDEDIFNDCKTFSGYATLIITNKRVIKEIDINRSESRFVVRNSFFE